MLLDEVVPAVVLEVLDQEVVVGHEEVAELQDGFLVVGLLLDEVAQLLVEALEDGHHFLEELRAVLVVIGEVCSHLSYVFLKDGIVVLVDLIDLLEVLDKGVDALLEVLGLPLEDAVVALREDAPRH